MGTPVKPTTRRTTRKILQATEDSHALDLHTYRLQIWMPLQITNPNSMTLGWEQMGKCTTAAAAGRNITRLI